MKECHVSPSTISNVKKKLSGVESDASKKNGQTSKETQALKLFDQGRALVDVAIELDIPSESVMTMYENFQRLKNMGSFVSAYNQVNGDIEPFLRLFDLMNYLGMTPEQVAQQAEFGIKLPLLEKMRLDQSRNIQWLNWQKQQLEMQLNAMQKQTEKGKSALDFYVNQCQAKKNEHMALAAEINTQKNVIETLDNDEGYTKIKETAKTEIKKFMQNNQAILAVTLSATLEAVRRYPEGKKLFFDIVTSQIIAGPSYPHSGIQSHMPQLMQLMQQVQNEMADQISRIIVRTMNSTTT